ncbi:MAG: HAD family hydrolase [Oligoflexia bacterium]|nr:HAD family hydrolase [Oligoflexia bacterium]
MPNLSPLPYRVLATDYDGTLARQGRVSVEAVNELRRWKGAGGLVVLVTGRELEELQRVFPSVSVCDLVIAENGALIYRPATGRIELLGERPPRVFVEELRRRGVNPLSVGRSIVSTVQPHGAAVREAIVDLKLSLQIIMNKESVMVLPANIDKGTGLRAALKELNVSPRDCVAVGDAENDLALFDAAGLGCAVLNSTKNLRARAAVKLEKPDYEGVCELLQNLMSGRLRRRVA